MSLVWQVIRMIFYLLAIIVLFFVVVKLLRNYKLISGLNNKHLTIIDRLHFNSNQALYLVRVVDEVWIIGASDQQINLLTKIDEPQVEELTADNEVNDWQQEIKKFLNRDEANND
ncbi:MAG: FliO/MopB family protein [Bacillota bacterium]